MRKNVYAALTFLFSSYLNGSAFFENPSVNDSGKKTKENTAKTISASAYVISIYTLIYIAVSFYFSYHRTLALFTHFY